MSRTIGRGVENKKETVDTLKEDLKVAKKAGEELIEKNKELEEKVKAAEAKPSSKTQTKPENN